MRNHDAQYRHFPEQNLEPPEWMYSDGKEECSWCGIEIHGRMKKSGILQFCFDTDCEKAYEQDTEYMVESDAREEARKENELRRAI